MAEAKHMLSRIHKYTTEAGILFDKLQDIVFQLSSLIHIQWVPVGGSSRKVEGDDPSNLSEGHGSLWASKSRGAEAEIGTDAH